MVTRRSAIKLVAVNLAILLFGLATLEFIFGGWMDPGRISRLRIPRNKILDISLNGLYPHPTGVIRYTRDRFGLRGSFLTPRQVELVTVGGSTTNQRYIDDTQTWQRVLEAEFKSAEQPVVIANAGVDGQSSLGHILMLESWFPELPGFKPRYVLFYVGLNDYYYTEDEEPVLPSLSDSKDSGSFGLRSLKERSAIWHLVRTGLGWYQAKRLAFTHQKINLATLPWTTRGRLSEYSELTAPACRGYTKRLKRLAQAVTAMGARPIFVTQPSRHYRFVNSSLEGLEVDFPFGEHSANGIDFYHIIRAYDGAMMTLCAEVGGICIDIDKTIWSDEDFYDYVHVTPTGAKKLGQELFKRLRSVLNDPFL